MMCYACWLGIAFFNVVNTRFKLHVLILSYEESGSLCKEAMVHVFILLGSAGAAAVAAFKGDIGSNSGITSCWIEGYEWQQVYYYYGFMVIGVGCGVVTSFVATARLWWVLSSAGPTDMWDAAHRPLRRVIYGNAAWSVFCMVIAVVPIVDVVVLTKFTCWLANISCCTCGILFLLAYYVVPNYLEGCFERQHIRNSTSLQGSHHKYEGLSGEPTYKYGDKSTTYMQTSASTLSTFKTSASNPVFTMPSIGRISEGRPPNTMPSAISSAPTNIYW
jgi:hypothetical protein